MKYVLAVVMLMMVSVGAWADGEQTVVKDEDYCRNKLNAVDENRDDDLSMEKTIDLLDDLSGESDIGGRCTKFTTNLNDSKVTIRWIGRTEEQNRDWNWEFKLQAPFEVKDQMDIKDIDFDGLANALKITMGGSYVDRKREGRDKKTFTRLGFSGSVAYESFDFINGNDINNVINQRKAHKELRAFWAYYSTEKATWGRDFMIGTGLKYQQSYRAGEQKNICVNSGLDSSQCANVIIGAPEEDTKQFAVLDARVAFKNQGVNVGLKVTHDIENSLTKVDLPVYRLREGKKDVLAGVVISWDSLTREPRATLMVGSTFGFLDKF